jgi:hypothetical protein
MSSLMDSNRIKSLHSSLACTRDSSFCAARTTILPYNTHYLEYHDEVFAPKGTDNLGYSFCLNFISNYLRVDLIQTFDELCRLGKTICQFRYQ